MSTSPLIQPPICITFSGSKEEITFERVSDVIDWAELQVDAWIEVKFPNHQLGQHWNNQKSYAATVKQIGRQLEELLKEPEEARTPAILQKIKDLDTQLRQGLEKYSNGQAISTSHPHFAHIQAIAEADPNAGAVLLAACLSNGQQFLAQHAHFDAIARIGVASTYLDDARRKTIQALKADLNLLKKRGKSDISELRTAIDDQLAQSAQQAQDHEQSVNNRSTAWDTLTDKCNKEWDELKRVYDEKLALLAPTEYWRTRSAAHRTKARNYAIAFSIALAILVGVFIYFGVGHLGDPGTGSVVIAVLPVLIPAFAGVWVLRILGRLLSENLKIAQDAQERETLVKTFLALMRDDTTGKSVVTDEDRTLILHALFRQSTVTAVDDAPPLHWLEMMRKGKP